MAQYKSLLKRYEIQVAQRRRKCKHNRAHVICAGEKCLVVYEGQIGRFPYCMECASEMFKETRERISEEIEEFE